MAKCLKFQEEPEELKGIIQFPKITNNIDQFYEVERNITWFKYNATAWITTIKPNHVQCISPPGASPMLSGYRFEQIININHDGKRTVEVNRIVTLGPKPAVKIGALTNTEQLIDDVIAKSSDIEYFSSSATSATKNLGSVDFDQIVKIAVNSTDNYGTHVQTSHLLNPIVPFIMLALLSLICAFCIPCVGCKLACFSRGNRRSPREYTRQNRLFGLVNLVFVVACCILILVCVATLFLVGRNLKDYYNSTFQLMTNSLRDIADFLANARKSIDMVVTTDVYRIINETNETVSGFSDYEVQPLADLWNTSYGNFTETALQIQVLKRNITHWQLGLNSTISTLQMALNMIFDNIDIIRTNMSTVVTQCGTLQECDSLKTAFYSYSRPPKINLTLPADMGALTKLISNAVDVDALNKTFYTTWENVFEAVKRNVSNHSSIIGDALNKMYANSSQQLAKLENNFHALDQFIKKAQNKLSQDATAYQVGSQLVVYLTTVTYLWSLMILSIIIVATIGVIEIVFSFVIITTNKFWKWWKPNQKQRAKYRQRGRYILRGAICCSSFAVFLLLINGTLAMFLGFFLTDGCTKLLNFELIDILDNPELNHGKYFLSSKLLGNGSIKLTFSDILHACRNDSGFYYPAKLDYVVNMFIFDNIKNFIPDTSLATQLGSLFKNISFIPPGSPNMANLTDSASKMLDSFNLPGINIALYQAVASSKMLVTTYNNGLNSSIVSLNVSNATYITSLKTNLQNLRATELDFDHANTTYAQPAAEDIFLIRNGYNTWLFDLATLFNVTTDFSSKLSSQSVDLLAEGFNNLYDKYIMMVKNALNKYLSDIMDKDVAPCKIVWNSFDNVSRLLCSAGLSYLNSSWLAFILCGYAFILLIFSGHLLIKHLPEAEE